MTSVITDRVSGAVNGAPVNPGGVLQGDSVTGTNDIVADTFPNISAYYANLLVLVRPANANTGAVTLDLGPGVKPWNKPSGAAHAAGDLSPSIEYLVKLDDAMTEFRTITPLG